MGINMGDKRIIMVYKLIHEAVEQRDFYSCYTVQNAKVFYSRHDVDKFERTALKLCTQWGYHAPYINSSKGVDYYKQWAAKLLKLNIPCGYNLLAHLYMRNDFGESIFSFGIGMENGCSSCKWEMEDSEKGRHNSFIYNIIKENRNLKKLKDCSLEEVIKNIISEYL
jgi:hypothetical protein